jgi:transposase InsO family protein
MPHSYPPELRRKVLDLVEAGRPVAEVAQLLGVSDQTIYTWRRQHRIDTGQEPGITSSDHGTQFTSWAFTQRAHASGLVPSMGSVGDCADNALMESFWGRVQTELLNRRRWRTRLELANALFEYLEIFHNRQRRHSALGMLTPIEYELRPAHVA